MNWKQILAGLCGFAFGFWLCMPRDVVLLPRYEVLVVDASGQGIPGIPVKQIRQDFAISNAVSSSLATADAYGRVAFPSVAGHTSPLRRLILCGRRIASNGINTPCGYLHQITAEVPGTSEASRSQTDLPLKNRGRLLRIVMQPAKP